MPQFQGLHVGDMDGDMDIDIISGSYADGKIRLFLNIDGKANIFVQILVFNNAPGVSYLDRKYYKYHRWCYYSLSYLNLTVYDTNLAVDIDGDGDLDIISASNDDNYVRWYR